jgi:hypothetical protein
VLAGNGLVGRSGTDVNRIAGWHGIFKGHKFSLGL